MSSSGARHDGHRRADPGIRDFGEGVPGLVRQRESPSENSSNEPGGVAIAVISVLVVIATSSELALPCRDCGYIMTRTVRRVCRTECIERAEDANKVSDGKLGFELDGGSDRAI